MTGYSLFLFNFVLSTRLKIFDKIFNGVNRAYQIHHLSGAFAFSLLLMHPVFLTLSYLTVSLTVAFTQLFPSLSNIATLFGSLALGVTILLLFITFFVNLEYDRWKLTHKFLGIALGFSVLHLLLIGSTVALSLPLKIYFYPLAFLAIASYLYRTIFGRYLIPKRKMLVSRVENLNLDTFAIYFKPEDGGKFDYRPGQYLFLQMESRG